MFGAVKVMPLRVKSRLGTLLIVKVTLFAFATFVIVATTVCVGVLALCGLADGLVIVTVGAGLTLRTITVDFVSEPALFVPVIVMVLLPAFMATFVAVKLVPLKLKLVTF